MLIYLSKYDLEISNLKKPILLYRPEIQCKCHKGSPQKEYFFEDTCFTRNIHKYRFKKKICFKIPRIFVLENVICIFVKNLVNVGKKLETKLQYIDIYLHNKNVLEYGLLLVGSGRFMIFHIEGLSNTLT